MAGCGSAKELKLRFIHFALTFHCLCIRQDVVRQNHTRGLDAFALTFHCLCFRHCFAVCPLSFSGVCPEKWMRLY